ncbi:DNA mismatch repair protein msh6 [Entophlyctis luteolus]|nr:DNA mismatch repair protein msh6 [Entophlyctis luteolus]
MSIPATDGSGDGDDDDGAPLRMRTKKRSMLVMDDDDDEDTNASGLPKNGANTPLAHKRRRSEIADDPDHWKATSTPSRASLSQFTLSNNGDQTPRTPATAKTPMSAKSTPFASEKKKDRADDFAKRNTERYSWLLDERDENKRRPGEEGYDPRTLFIPQSAWNSFSAFEHQFWEIKCKHWDTIVFFKKGKFYELYEKDAEVAHKEFDWKLTDRVNMKMAGAPEMSFDSWASQFVARGYKVAKVDQVENAIAKDMNKKKQTGPVSKKDNIIRRELTMVLTSGTLVDTQLLTSEMSTYCMSIKEDYSLNEPSFGIAFVDTSTAEFRLSWFTDDSDRTRLETLLMQLKPKELVLEKGGLHAKTQKLIKNCLNNPLCNYLMPDTEYWSSAATIDELSRTYYFGKLSESAEVCKYVTKRCMIEFFQLWNTLRLLLHVLKSQLPCPLWVDYCLICERWELKLDKDLVSARNFNVYDPLSQSGHLVLDGQTLLNLEVFENTSDGSAEGTLFKLLNGCITAGGKRLFKSWVCHPLQDVRAINNRLDAVDDIQNSLDFQDDVIACFRKLPDLERIISRIHAGSCRVKDFMLALHGFADIFNFLSDSRKYTEHFQSAQLSNLLTQTGSDTLLSELKFFDEAFDHSNGLATTEIIANVGYDEIYDETTARVDRILAEFEAHRKDKERELSCKLSYRDLGKDLFQLEVPTSKKVPKSWVLMTKTQSVSRYYTPEIKEILERYLEAREERDQASKNVRGRMFAKFDEYYPEWLTVTRRIAEIDCLLSLALCVARMMDGPVCRPVFVESSHGGVFDVRDLRHPCARTEPGKDFIPNDTVLGRESPNMILLTGPNMGGKSTLLRQTCIAVIMAQLGCYVPATSCTMTPFERIFTRIGAHDNILAGQSTFMVSGIRWLSPFLPVANNAAFEQVELSETSKILREATARSLVILDELGRGTSTFDGFAIAFSVLYHLVTKTCCLGLFSTHYGMLTKEFEDNPLVALKHMSFVSEENKLDIIECLFFGSQNFTDISLIVLFLQIVDTAERVAEDFERKLKMAKELNVSG